jgi:hypothetical protein
MSSGKLFLSRGYKIQVRAGKEPVYNGKNVGLLLFCCRHVSLYMCKECWREMLQ